MFNYFVVFCWYAARNRTVFGNSVWETDEPISTIEHIREIEEANETLFEIDKVVVTDWKLLREDLL